MRPRSIWLWLGAFAACLTSEASAQNYPWCANFADGAGVNCGFSTYEQCMATSQGSGGFCTKNNLYVTPHATAPARHATHKHRLRRKF